MQGTQLLYWSIAAGACTTLGAVLLFIKKNWTDQSLALFLGLASGVMVAVVVFDMLPSAFLFSGFRGAVAGLLIGMLGMAVCNAFLFQPLARRDSLIALGYLVMLGIAMHDLPEGMAIALGGEMKARTGMVIAMGIGIHNIPEGMAIAAPLLMAGGRKMKIFAQTLLVGVITPVGTLLGRLVVEILPQLLPLLLGLASGVMVYLVFRQLWPQAGLKDRYSRWWGFWLGMAVILLATFL